jgi:type IV pilus assembly protein PilA
VLRNILEREQGFSLIELLVVTMIIGALAGIGLPAFLGAEQKSQDGDAKANARNVASAVESCFTDTDAYSACDTAAKLAASGSKTGVDLTDTTVRQAGAVSVTAGDSTYTIVGYSQSGNTFSIVKLSDGTSSRSCTAAQEGGCGSGAGVW